jgi:hypothetical protein
MDDSNIKRKTGDDDINTSSSSKKKAKKSTTPAKSYVYPVFETFDGMRCPRYEGGVKEKSVQLVGIFMNEGNAESFCTIQNHEANRIKEALEGEVNKYESNFSYKKTSLIRKIGANSLLPQIEGMWLHPITIIRDTDPDPFNW